MKPITVSELMDKLGAKEHDIYWESTMPFELAWYHCQRGQAMAWTAARLGLHNFLLVYALCELASRALEKHAKAAVGQTAVKKIRLYHQGSSTIDEVRHAAHRVMRACEAAFEHGDTALAHALLATWHAAYVILPRDLAVDEHARKRSASHASMCVQSFVISLSASGKRTTNDLQYEAAYVLRAYIPRSTIMHAVHCYLTPPEHQDDAQDDGQTDDVRYVAVQHKDGCVRTMRVTEEMTVGEVVRWAALEPTLGDVILTTQARAALVGAL